MATMVDKHEVDLTKGPIFSKLIKFALPFVFTNILTLLFHATDIATLRFMVGGKAVAAVSSTASLTSLFINFFVGFSSGASVVLSKCVGSNNVDKARRIVGTAMCFSIIAGIFIMIVAWFGAETFLRGTDCPENLLPQASKYLRVYLLGAPITLFYNLGAGMLRAVGDSLRPMIYLMISGVANIVLNIFFIAVFNLTVEGVAIGTISSQLISSVLIFIAMKRSKGFSRFEFKFLKIHGKEFLEIIAIGLPTAIQSSLFSISNVLIQSSINTFGELAIEGDGGAKQIDAFIYTVGNAIAHASMSFVSQNLGARNMERVKKTINTAILCTIVIQLAFGLICFLWAQPLLSLFVETEGAFIYGKERLLIMSLFYFMSGVMDVFQLSMRAMGKSTTSMILAIFFVCIFRIIWLNSFFLLKPVFLMIFISYPVSWALNILAHILLILPLVKKLTKQFSKQRQGEKTTQEISQTNL